MNREVCLFDKFSYCKNGVRCLRIHLKEICWNRECDYRKCNKRHPRPCKIFQERGHCKFGTSCRYSHRPPKIIEEQNKKIESLENNTAKLLKQVADQDAIIKDLNKKLFERECNELKSLQKQIDDLVQKNDEKEKAIKKLETDVNDIKDNCIAEDSSDEYEDINEDEVVEHEIPKHSSYIEKALFHLDETKKDIEKMRKNTRDAKVQIENLCQVLTSLPSRFGFSDKNRFDNYWDPVEELKEFVKSNDTKMDKETCLTKIMKLKQQLQWIIVD